MSPPIPFENLSGPGKPLKAEPPDAAEQAGLLRTGQTRLRDVDQRLVTDLINATQRVLRALQAPE